MLVYVLFGGVCLVLALLVSSQKSIKIIESHLKTAFRNKSVLVCVLFGGVCLYSPYLSPGFTLLKALQLSARSISDVSGL